MHVAAPDPERDPALARERDQAGDAGTDTEAPEADQRDTEATDTEATDTEATDTEPTDTEATDTEEATADHIYDIVESEVESYLLGTSRRRTTSELVERASVTLDEATDLWVALGFPIPRERDGARFTDADADATHTLAGLVEDGIIDAEMRLALARTIGQATARLAEWQIDVLTSEILAGLENLGDDPSDRQIRKLARSHRGAHRPRARTHAELRLAPAHGRGHAPLARRHPHRPRRARPRRRLRRYGRLHRPHPSSRP